jgi:hypothetical protein
MFVGRADRYEAKKSKLSVAGFEGLYSYVNIGTLRGRS